MRYVLSLLNEPYLKVSLRLNYGLIMSCGIQFDCFSVTSLISVQIRLINLHLISYHNWCSLVLLKCFKPGYSKAILSRVINSLDYGLIQFKLHLFMSFRLSLIQLNLNTRCLIWSIGIGTQNEQLPLKIIQNLSPVSP